MSRTADRIHGEQLPGNEKIKHISYSDTPYYMKPGDFILIVDSTDGAVDVYLPPKDQAAGRGIYYVHATTGATNDVSVLDRENKTEIATYGDMDAANDNAGFFCTGLAWQMVFENVA